MGGIINLVSLFPPNFGCPQGKKGKTGSGGAVYLLEFFGGIFLGEGKQFF